MLLFAARMKYGKGKLLTQPRFIATFVMSQIYTQMIVFVRVPPLTKNFLCRLFRLCETFSQTFLMPPKGPPFNFFSILQKNGCSKLSKGPPFTFFGTMRLIEDQKKRKKFQKSSDFFSIFSSCGYCRRE